MPKVYRAHPGKSFPLKVNRKLHFITSDEDFSVEESSIDYVTKVHLKRAIEDNDIFEVGEKKSQKKNKEGDK